ncbi:hypothetical protein [Paenibacillus silviterrae]|uniref:hypothetical protein n=1 Tax=Paenibacillus silviterrae TaxID=3242194 RepID=UPI002543E264|nr:hypothetical protein [Paenibacillus chinjuensis]
MNPLIDHDHKSQLHVEYMELWKELEEHDEFYIRRYIDGCRRRLRKQQLYAKFGFSDMFPMKPLELVLSALFGVLFTVMFFVFLIMFMLKIE